MIHTPKLISASFLFAGIILTIVGSSQQLTADLSGQGSALTDPRPVQLEWAQGDGHYAASPKRSNVAGQIALGTLFIAIGFGLHALMVIRKSDERPVRVRAATGKKIQEPTKPRTQRKMEVIWIERTIRL